MHPIRDRIRDLIFLETHPLPKFKRPALTLLRFAYHIIAKAWQDAVARRAAALSFFTVLYLLPLSVLVLFGLSRSPLFRDQMADVQARTGRVESAIVGHRLRRKQSLKPLDVGALLYEIARPKLFQS